MNYGSLIGQVAEETGVPMDWPSSLERTPIGFPVIQYEETDWEFLKRIASRFGLSLYPALGGRSVSIGIPEGGMQEAIEWIRCTMIQDKKWYGLGGEASGYDRGQLLSYELESYEDHWCGGRHLFQGRMLPICARSCRAEKGELVFTYRLASPEWAGQRRMSNEKISGLSLLGTVVSRDKETVCLSLDIDGGEERGNYPFPWTPATGNLMYLMPAVGSRVSLYFKGSEESSALAVNCVRKEGEGRGNSYEERSLTAEGGKELKLYPQCMGFASVNSRVLLDDLEGITIEGEKSLRIIADGKIRLEGQEIRLTAEAFHLYDGKIELGRKGKASFQKEAEFHLTEEKGHLSIVSLGDSTRLLGYEVEDYNGSQYRFRDDTIEGSQ